MKTDKIKPWIEINKEIDLIILTSKKLAEIPDNNSREKTAIKTPILKMAMNELISFAESKKNLYTYEIIAVEDIYENYMQEVSERIKLCFPYSHSSEYTYAVYIRSFLQAWKKATDGVYPKFLILAGDIEYIPAFYVPMPGYYPNYGDQMLRDVITMGEALGNLSDFYYGDLVSNYLEGEFYPPTIAVSRLPADNPSELMLMCKSLREKKPDSKNKILTIASNQKFFDNGKIYLDNRFINGAIRILDDFTLPGEKNKEIFSEKEQKKYSWVIKSNTTHNNSWHMSVCFQQVDKETNNNLDEDIKINILNELTNIINNKNFILSYRGESWYDRWNVSYNTNWEGITGIKSDLNYLNKIDYIPVVLSFGTMNCMLETDDYKNDKKERIHKHLFPFIKNMCHRRRSSTTVMQLKDIMENILESIFCINNVQFDKECCFGKRWLLEKKTGAFLGMTRVPYFQYNQILNKAIFKEIIKDHKKPISIGEVIQDAIRNIYKEYSYNDILFKPLKEQLKAYLLLGDATLQVPLSSDQK